MLEKLIKLISENVIGFDDTYEKLFSQLFAKFEQKGISLSSGVIDEEINPFFIRLINKLKAAKNVGQDILASHAYTLFCFIEYYMGEHITAVQEKKHVSDEARTVALSQLRASCKILDNCPVFLIPFLKIKEDKEGIQTLTAEGLSEHILEIKGNAQDRDKACNDIIDRELKRPMQGVIDAEVAYLNIDNSGTIFFDRAQLKKDSESAITRGKIVSIESGLDHEFLKRYFIILNILTKTPEEQYKKILELGIFVQNFLIPEKYLNKYGKFLEQLPQEYILKNYIKLIKTFDQNKLCHEIVEDKEVLSTAFQKTPNNAVLNILPAEQVFLLSVFRFNIHPDKLKQIWSKPGEPYPLMAIIQQFENSNFGASAKNYPLNLQKLTEMSQLKPQLVIWQIMVNLQGYFPIPYMVDFAKKYLPNKEKEDFIQLLHKQYCPTPEAQGRWLESINNPTTVQDLIYLFNQYNLYVDKTIIANRFFSQATIELPIDPLLGLIQPIDSPETKQAPVSEPVENKLKPIEYLRANVKKYSSANIRRLAFTALTDYSDEHFVYNNGSYITKKYVPANRLGAFEQIKEVISIQDYNWNNFLQLYADKNFKKRSGSGLFSFSALWPIIESIFSHIQEQQHFYQELKEDSVLRQALEDEECWLELSLSQEDFYWIYHHCNKAVFLEAMVKHPNWRKKWGEGFLVQKKVGGSSVLDAKSIENMTIVIQETDANNEINKLRFQFNIAQNIPTGYVKPGIEELKGHETLSPELLYQLEEADVTVGENYLVTQYASVLSNTFKQTDAIEFKLERKNNSDNKIKFFHIPMSFDPVLLSNAGYAATRETTFKNRLTHLIASHVPKQGEKPIVFCGIVNTTGNHWIPYFIYKNLQNKIQIICVNPSSSVKGWDEKAAEKDQCPKLKIHKKLTAAFETIFPGCEVRDPNVPQQTRQRDCGYNALTVLRDAYAKVSEAFPLIEIDQQDKLQIYPERLTINFSHMALYNYERNCFVFPPLTQERSKQNRRVWGEIFDKAQFVSSVTFDGLPTVQSSYGFVALQEYSYRTSIKKQEQVDRFGELRGSVFAAISQLRDSSQQFGAARWESDQDLKFFIENLTLPSDDRINKYADALEKDFKSIMDEIRQHDLQPQEIIKAVLADNLKPHFARALETYFDQFIKDYLVTDPNMTSAGIVDDYLRHPKVKSFFTQLPGGEQKSDLNQAENQKKQVREAILVKAKAKFDLKMQAYHIAVINQVIQRELFPILKMLPDPGQVPDLKTVGGRVLDYLKKEPTVEQSFNWLSKQNRDLLPALTQTISQLTHAIARKIANYLEDQLSHRELEEVAQFVVNDGKLSLLGSGLESLLPKNPLPDCPLVQSELLRRESALNMEVEFKATNYNLFARLLSSQVDGYLQDAVIRQLSRMVNLKAKLKLQGDIYKEKTLSDLDLIAYDKNPFFVEAFAEDIDLYAALVNFRELPWYEKAKLDLTSMVRDYAKAEIAKRLHSTSQFVLSQYHVVNKNNLITLFASLNNQNEFNLNLRIMMAELSESKAIADDNQANKNALIIMINERNFPVFCKNQGELFIKHFKKIDDVITSFAQKATMYEQSTQFVLTCFQKFAAEQQNHRMPEDKSIILAITSINALLKRYTTIKQLIADLKYIPIGEIENQLQHYRREVLDLFNEVIRILKKNCKPGNVSPHDFSNWSRLILCHILNIRNSEKAFPPLYIDGQTATIIDSQIQEGARVVHLPSNEIQFPSFVSPENAIRVQHKPITKEFLSELLANWMACADVNLLQGKPYPDIAMAGLAHALNHVPADAKAILPEAWVKQHIVNQIIFADPKGMATMSDVSWQAVAALSVCTLPRRTQMENYVAAAKQIKISHLEDILQLYHRQSKGELVKTYVDHLAPQIGQLPKNSLFKKGIFKKTQSDEMQCLTNCIKHIRLRHDTPHPRDIALDRGDIQLLETLLFERWMNLTREAKEITPTNYFAGHHMRASDAVFSVVALIVKQALTYFGIKKSACKLLMPTTRIRDTIKLKVLNGLELKAELLNDDIDNYNWQELITHCTLSDGTWLPHDLVLDNYRKGLGLINPFSKKLLTEAQLREYIDINPVFKSEMQNIIRGKYFISINMDTAKKILSHFNQKDDKKPDPDQKRENQSQLIGFISFMSEKLTDIERESLLNLFVPFDHRQLKHIIADSENTCGNQFVIGVIKTLWQNCPALTVADLGKHFEAIKQELNLIVRNEHGVKVDINQIPANERMLVELCMQNHNRQPLNLRQ